MNKFTFSTVTAFVQYILSSNALLFGVYLLLNVFDFASAYMCVLLKRRAYDTHVFTVGIVRTIGTWITIMVSFVASAFLQHLGESIGVDLRVVQLLGWFVLASFIFNEFRSVLGNLSQAGIQIPPLLVKVLDIAEKQMEGAPLDSKDVDGQLVIDLENMDEETLKINFAQTLDEVRTKDTVTFRVINQDKKES